MDYGAPSAGGQSAEVKVELNNLIKQIMTQQAGSS